MKRLLTLVALAATLTASAQVKVVKLWDNASAPHSNEDAGPQKEKNGNLYNTVDTELFIYPAAPDKATGQAVVVCPGGGYRFVSMPREGHEVGEWLSAEGITVVALKYRLPNGHCQVPLEDAEAAAFSRRAASSVKFEYALSRSILLRILKANCLSFINYLLLLFVSNSNLKRFAAETAKDATYVIAAALRTRFAPGSSSYDNIPVFSITSTARRLALNSTGSVTSWNSITKT